MHRNLTQQLPLLALLACAACSRPRVEPEPAPESVPAPEEEADWSWVAVATFHNPSLSERGALAHDVLVAALESEGIHAISAGSRGFTMSVSSVDAGRARKIVARAIEAEGLEAQPVAE